MSAQNTNLERPCPSCGATLKVNEERLKQKLQCPKCMSVFVLEGIAPPAEKETKPAPKKSSAKVAEDVDLATRYRDLLARHVELADRYEEVITRYEQVIDDHEKLADQIRHLWG